MAKSLFSIKEKIWILAPNSGVRPFLKKLTFLEVYYLFGQIEFIDLFRAQGGQDGEQDSEINHFKASVLIQLEAKIAAVKIFAGLLRKQERKVLRIWKLKKFFYRFKKTWSHKSEEKFFAFLLGYLNAFIAVTDLVKQIDEKLETTDLSIGILDQEWFHYTDALRAASQHEESPLISTDEGKAVTLTFNRLSELQTRHHARFNWIGSQERHTIGIDCKDIENGLINFLETWAKNHLDSISNEKKLDVVSGFNFKGQPIFEKVTLGELLQHVVSNDI